MRCFDCRKGSYTTRTAQVIGEVRGETVNVSTEAEVCQRCGSQVLTDAQSARYAIAVADAYRRKHGLLTSDELREIRSRLGMSQRAFANYLRVGEASVKRWESGLIQDGSHDELIRLKTDLDAARSNAARLEKMSGAAAPTTARPATQFEMFVVPRQQHGHWTPYWAPSRQPEDSTRGRNR